MNNPIYMIMLGEALNRKVIICGSDFCYPMFRERNNLVSDWVGIFYAEDSKKLVKAYKSLAPTPFGKMLNQMLKENEGEGGGTTTDLSLDGVKGLLEDSELGLEIYAEKIYEALIGKEKAMVRLDK